MKCIRSVLLLAAFLSVGAWGSTLINGAGASFPYPLYSKWFSEYQKSHSDTRINYQSIGSGGGIRQFSRGTVYFGATDAPMKDAEIAKVASKGPVLHIPTVLGAVVITYNLPSVKEPLQLDGPLIADIFLGKVKKWNDPRIVKLNPKQALPASEIFVVRRSDGSGTTKIFTDYLSNVSPTWQNTVGMGKAVKWPVGLGGKGNEGVAGMVKQTVGALGYSEFIYASTNGLPSAKIKNEAGEFVAPSIASVSKAADGALATMPEDFRVSITNAEGKGAYPVSGFTYLLVWQQQPDAVKGQKLVQFLRWAVNEGQKFASGLNYAPLPKSLVAKVEQKIDTIRLPGGKPVAGE